MRQCRLRTIQLSAVAMMLSLASAGCFEPSYGERPFACARAGACPAGYRCVAGVCQRGGAAGDVGDAGGDGPGNADAFAWPASGTVKLFRGADLPDGTTYDGVVDVILQSNFPTANGQWLPLSVTAASVVLIRFDASQLALPAQARLLRATLMLHVEAASGFLGLRPHRCLRPWKVAEATWIEASEGQRWTAAGAKGALDCFETQPRAPRVPVAQGEDYPLAADLTGLDVARVFSVALRSEGSGGFIRLASSEDADASRRPTLQLTYTSAPADGGMD